MLILLLSVAFITTSVQSDVNPSHEARLSFCVYSKARLHQLDSPEWHQVLKEGGIHIRENNARSKRFVTLETGQTNKPFQACLAPGNQTGHCRHLHYCILDEFKENFLKFMDYMCIIDRSAIGVCCPDKEEIKVREVRALASNDNEQEANDANQNIRIKAEERARLHQLDSPEWHQVLKEGGIHIRENNARYKRFVTLETGQTNKPFQACLAPGNQTGHCRHLHYCILDEFKENFLKFMDYMCIIERSAIGVCCPDRGENRVQGVRALAGDLPQSAGNDIEQEANDANQNTIRIKAEERGCGVSSSRMDAAGRVVGARPAQPGAWPWMASLLLFGVHHGGGTLVTDRHVLTAAHVTYGSKASDFMVRLGEYDFKQPEETRFRDFRIIEIRQHVDFQQQNYHHDIAIVKLNRPAIFNSYVWPICLPPVKDMLENDTVTVIGWGTESYGGPSSKVLLEVTVPVWAQARCRATYVETIFDTNICAGGYDGMQDACQGDSGGPLMHKLASGRWVLVGVVSWGIGCGEQGRPGVYTKINQYLRWIIENAAF